MVDTYYKNRLFDSIVIGGGISGLGVALESSSKGFDTLVLERGKICAETSANSLRIIHGGFRYLQSGNLLRVVESIQEQNRVLREAPSLVKLLPCVMPLARFGLKSRVPVEFATRFYNFLTENFSGQANRSSIISKEFINKHIPMLAGQAPHGALLWYDARLRDPYKFAQLIRHKIDREGGDILEGVEVVRITKQERVFVVHCVEGTESFEVCARSVVNASGPWLDTVECAWARRPRFQWSRAFNVILNRKLQERFAIGGQSRSGRLFFAVPRADGTAIGTGYLPANDSIEGISEDELWRFIKDFNETFPHAKVTNDDVASIECGRIPVRSIRHDGRKVCFLGRSEIYDHGGMIDLLSTKYTTFHSQGARVLSKMLRYLR